MADRSITFHADGSISIRLAPGQRASVLSTEDGIVEISFARPGTTRVVTEGGPEFETRSHALAVKAGVTRAYASARQLRGPSE